MGSFWGSAVQAARDFSFYPVGHGQHSEHTEEGRGGAQEERLPRERCGGTVARRSTGEAVGRPDGEALAETALRRLWALLELLRLRHWWRDRAESILRPESPGRDLIRRQRRHHFAFRNSR